MGTLLLEGGKELQGEMAIPDRKALELAGGSRAVVRIIATAAAPDNNHLRAGRNGESWFRRLGAENASIVPIKDRKDAQNPQLAESLENADFIYLLGGFPGYLAETLRETACWSALVSAYDQGAVIAGSSAGAMVLASVFYDPYREEILPGLGLVLRICVIPHHNTFGKAWVPLLAPKLPGITLVGIDEQTGLLKEEGEKSWRVLGRGSAAVYGSDGTVAHVSGERCLPEI